MMGGYLTAEDREADALADAEELAWELAHPDEAAIFHATTCRRCRMPLHRGHCGPVSSGVERREMAGHPGVRSSDGPVAPRRMDKTP